MKIINNSLFVLLVITITILVLTGHPFSAFFYTNKEIVSVFRILFCLIVIIKISRSYNAIPLIFGYRASLKRRPRILFGLMILLGFLVFVGFLTDIASFLLFGTYVFTFSKSKYYSIENIYFQNTLFFLPFLGAGSHYSADALLGIEPLWNDPFMFNGLFLANGLLMLSAGYEKLKSPLWRGGRGAVAFLLMPHLVKRVLLVPMSKLKPVIFVLGYLVMFSEFFLVFSAIDKNWITINLLILLCFSIGLLVIVDLSFIGEVTFVNTGLFFAVVILNKYPSYTFLLSISLNNVFLLFLTYLILFTTLFPKISAKLRFTFAERLLNGIICPIAVFTEKHLFGFYVFKLIDRETSKQLLDAFDCDGCFGKYQFFQPRYFQGAMYPITDYCLIVNKSGKSGPANVKFDQILDLCFAGLLSAGKTQGEVVLQVKKYDHDDDFTKFIRQSWVTILSVRFTSLGYEICELGLPPVVEKTLRTV